MSHVRCYCDSARRTDRPTGGVTAATTLSRREASRYDYVHPCRFWSLPASLSPALFVDSSMPYNRNISDGAFSVIPLIHDVRVDDNRVACLRNQTSEHITSARTQQVNNTHRFDVLQDLSRLAKFLCLLLHSVNHVFIIYALYFMRSTIILCGICSHFTLIIIIIIIISLIKCRLNAASIQWLKCIVSERLRLRP